MKGIHLIFERNRVQELRELMDQSVQCKEFVNRTAICKDDKMPLLLGGDLANVMDEHKENMVVASHLK